MNLTNNNKFRIIDPNEKYVGCVTQSLTFSSFRAFFEGLLETFQFRISSRDKEIIFFNILEFYICLNHAIDSKFSSYLYHNNKYLNIPTFVYNLIMILGLESHTGGSSPGFVRGRIFPKSDISVSYNSLIVEMSFTDFSMIVSNSIVFDNMVSNERAFSIFHKRMIEYFEDKGYSSFAPIGYDGILAGLNNLNTLFYYRDRINMTSGMLPFPISNKLGLFRYRCGLHDGQYIYSPLYERNIGTNYYDLFLLVFNPTYVDNFFPDSDLLSSEVSVTEESFYISGIEEKGAWKFFLSFSDEQYTPINNTIPLVDSNTNRALVSHQDSNKPNGRKYSTTSVRPFFMEVTGINRNGIEQKVLCLNYRYPHINSLFSIAGGALELFSNDRCNATISIILFAFTAYYITKLYHPSVIPRQDNDNESDSSSSIVDVDDSFTEAAEALKLHFDLVPKMFKEAFAHERIIYTSYENFSTDLNFDLYFEFGYGNKFVGYFVSHFTHLNSDVLIAKASTHSTTLRGYEIPDWFINNYLNQIYLAHFSDLPYDQFLLACKFVFWTYLSH